MQHGHYSTLKLCVLEIRHDGGGMWESTEGPRDPLGPIMLSWQDNTKLGRQITKSVSKSATTRSSMCLGGTYLRGKSCRALHGGPGDFVAPLGTCQ